jgi:hypothetical protein
LEVRARLGHVDVDGVELLDDGERRRLVGRHHRADRDRGPADPPRDRSLERRVGEVDPRALDGGPGRGDARLRPQERRLRVVVVLLADRVDLDEPREALGPRPGGREVRLGDGERRLRLVVRGPVGGGVDLVQQAARLDVPALLEGPLLDDAVHLGADLGDQVGGGPAGQLGRQQDALGVDRHRGHVDGALRTGSRPPRASGSRDGRQAQPEGLVAQLHGCSLRGRAGTGRLVDRLSRTHAGLAFCSPRPPGAMMRLTLHRDDS